MLQEISQPAFLEHLQKKEQTSRNENASVFPAILPIQRYRLYQEKGTSVSFISPFDIYFIESSFILREDRLEVLHFLEVHSFLIPLLMEAFVNIKKDFPFSKTFLRLVSDPEALDANEADKLVISIDTNLDPYDAADNLTRFGKRWWFKTWQRTRGKLSITLEF